MPRSSSATKKTTKKKPGGGSRSRRGSKSSKKNQGVFTNYHAAMKFLQDRVDVERTRAHRVDPDVFKLDRIRRLMEALGNPQDGLEIVHIAGTNGKGSIVSMLSAALQSCGCTVGTYTSPHLSDVRERIQLNDSMISHAQFTELMGRVSEAAETLPKKVGKPTFFEVLTALGLLYFAEQAVDIAILETGLGGRLDATNVVTPVVSAVAGIAMDHEAFLGSDLASIAREKAGIFKKDVPALTFVQDKEAIRAMREVAEEAGAPFAVVGDDIEFSYRFEASPQLGPHTRVGLSTERCVFEHVPVPLKGEHQALNCGLVLAIIDRLVERGMEMPTSKVIRGLANTQLPARMEILWREPRILLDGAHNPTSVQALIKSIGAHIPYDSLIMIFGCASDKDVDGLLEKVALGGDKIIFTRAKHTPRASNPRDLQRKFSEISPKMSQVADDLGEALSIAIRAASREDLICITGSFYLVGEARKLITDRIAKMNATA